MLVLNEEKMINMQAWNVVLNGEVIDTVFFDSDCTREYVKDSLINHDCYNSRIVLVKVRMIKPRLDIGLA